LIVNREHEQALDSAPPPRAVDLGVAAETSPTEVTRVKGAARVNSTPSLQPGPASRDDGDHRPRLRNAATFAVATCHH
jgi:hypothetical protein